MRLDAGNPLVSYFFFFCFLIFFSTRKDFSCRETPKNEFPSKSDEMWRNNRTFFKKIQRLDFSESGQIGFFKKKFDCFAKFHPNLLRNSFLGVSRRKKFKSKNGFPRDFQIFPCPIDLNFWLAHSGIQSHAFN